MLRKIGKIRWLLRIMSYVHFYILVSGVRILKKFVIQKQTYMQTHTHSKITFIPVTAPLLAALRYRRYVTGATLPALRLPAPRLPAPRLPALRLPAPRLPAPRLPALQLPALRLPALRLPALRLPALRLPALRLPALRLLTTAPPPDARLPIIVVILTSD